MSDNDDKVIEHPSIQIKKDLDMLKSEVRRLSNIISTLQSLHQTSSQALMVIHEENKSIKENIRRFLDKSADKSTPET